jgi:hypothetical protein
MPDILLEGTYKSFTIKAYSHTSGVSATSDTSDSISAKTLEKLKTKIDAIERKGFKRAKILIDSHRGYGLDSVSTVGAGVVTSHIDEKDIWIIVDKSRMKCNTKTVYIDTPSNREKLELMNGHRSDLEKFKTKTQENIKQLSDSLECYEIK